MKTATLPDDIRALTEALEIEFDAEVEAELVEGTSRYRVSLISPRFEGVSQMTRQDMAWQIVDRILGRESFMRLTLVLAFAPSELRSGE